MRRSMILAILCGALAIACLAGGVLSFIERPTLVRVAVPAEYHGDQALLSAASKVVRHGHHPIRFKVMVAADAKTASDDLDNGLVDMAVVRTDAVMPAQGQTVVILHRDAAILVVPHESAIKEISDFADHTVGILGSSDNQTLLDAALSQYDVAHDRVKRLSINRGDVEKAISDKTVDAVLAVGIISGALVQETVRAVTQAGGGPPSFVPVPEADAIAQRSTAYDSFDVVKGAFQGSPPLPSDNFDTLSVTHRLLANSTLGDSVVADVTRFFLSERSALVAVDPVAQRIEAPSTDKGAALPAHPGSAAYLDDEEETFLDAYSDYIYLAAMFFGVLASGATALFSRFTAKGAREAEDLIDRLVAILRSIRQAPSIEMLDVLEADTDDIVVTSLDRSFVRALDDRSAASLRLALEQVRTALRDRRLMLETGGVSPLPKPIPALFGASS